MRALKARECRLAVVAASIIGGAVLVEAVFLPQWRRYAQLGDTTARLEQTLSRMQANMRLRDEIELRYERLKGLIRESGTPSQELSRFARMLSGLYQPLKLETRSVRPLPDEDEGFYRKFTFALEMEGPVSELAKFLAATSKVVDPIRIERIQMSCGERPDVVTAQILVSKVATASRPAQEATPKVPRRTGAVLARRGRG